MLSSRGARGRCFIPGHLAPEVQPPPPGDHQDCDPFRELRTDCFILDGKPSVQSSAQDALPPHFGLMTARTARHVVVTALHVPP